MGQMKRTSSVFALSAAFFAMLAVCALCLNVASTIAATSQVAAEPEARASERAPVPSTAGERREGPADQARAQPPAARPTYADVVYGHASGQDLLLDVYVAESSEPTPVMVFIHGGGWRAGGKQMRSSFPLEDLLPEGISVVSVEYRFSDVAIHPAQVEDCTRAVQFVRYKAREWNIDPARIGVMGGSAGAHLALMVGLRDDAANPDSDDPVERESSRVSCIVSLAGPADFNLIRTIEHKHPAYRTLLGFEPGTPAEEIPQELLDDVSPITYASADDPPTLLLHGTADVTVPMEHPVRLDARLRELGVDSTLIKLEGAGHGLGLGKSGSPVRSQSVEFMKKHLFGERKAGITTKETPAPRAQ